MGRPLRIEYPGAVSHITSRGTERRAIFRDEADRRQFLGLLAEYHARYGVLIHSYVLMDNHYHLLLETPRGNLLKVMQGLNGGYTGYVNRKYARVGHLLQGRYKGIVVEKDAYLVALSRYIHLNPVRAQIMDRPERYAWSSYRGYVGKSKEAPWVEYAWILSQFGHNTHEARQGYRAFEEEGLTGSCDDPFKDVYGQVVLGGEEFAAKIRSLLRGRALSDEIVERKRFKETPSAEEIVRAVARIFGVQADALKRKGSRNNRARKVAVYGVKRYSGLSNAEIGAFFGGVHYSAVSKIAARLERERAEDRGLASLVAGLHSKVKT